MRRGEIAGLKWSSVNLTGKQIGEGKSALPARSVRIEENRVAVGRKIEAGTPKSKASNRTLPLPDDVVDALKVARKRQSEERLRYGRGTARASTSPAPRRARSTTRTCSRSGGASCSTISASIGCACMMRGTPAPR
jgi:integrase